LEHVLKEKIAQYNLGHVVIILPSQPKRTLLEMLIAADVFILNSLSEGCPNIILEAMSAGTYVMSAKHKGIQEMISSEEYGYLFAWNDVADIQRHISEIYKDRRRMEMKSKAAQQSLHRFDGGNALRGMIQCLIP
jgi:glycosyltransferase involved in cell wall biosynthesis